MTHPCCSEWRETALSDSKRNLNSTQPDSAYQSTHPSASDELRSLSPLVKKEKFDELRSPPIYLPLRRETTGAFNSCSAAAASSKENAWQPIAATNAQPH